MSKATAKRPFRLIDPKAFCDGKKCREETLRVDTEGLVAIDTGSPVVGTGKGVPMKRLTGRKSRALVHHRRPGKSLALARYHSFRGLGGGEWVNSWKWTDFIGVGTAGIGTAAARYFAEPGTFFSRHSGVAGGVAALVVGAARKDMTGALTGLLAGLLVEGVELLTDYRVAV